MFYSFFFFTGIELQGSGPGEECPDMMLMAFPKSDGAKLISDMIVAIVFTKTFSWVFSPEHRNFIALSKFRTLQVLSSLPLPLYFGSYLC